MIELYKISANQEYLAVLFQRYEHLILGSCLNYLSNEEEAQDAKMELYEHLKNALLKHFVENFKSWLFRVVYNHCMQIHRNQQRDTTKLTKYQKEVDVYMESWPNEHHNDVKEELLSNLERCIEELKSFQKECVQLFYIENKCYNEIVEKTGYALTKVKSYIQNGKRNLKNCIESRNEA